MNTASKIAVFLKKSVEKGGLLCLPDAYKRAFFLDIPKSARNPELLKRALLLTAGWCLYHENSKRTFNETVEFLDEWYRTVMWLASKGMDDKSGGETLKLVKKYSEQYRDSETRFINLDKINYYRLVCQAQANGSFESRRIVIPYRMIDVWKEKKVLEIDRGLHILYHYCGEMPRVTKTEIEIWLRGCSNVIKSHEILCYVFSPIGDSCKALFLTVDKAFRWSEGEKGVEILEVPHFANQLSDDNLQNLRIKNDPVYWLRECVAPTENMSWYERKRDLGKVTKPKASNLKRCVLAMLYAAAANSNSAEWQDLGAVLPYVQWDEKVALNWKEIEQWALENHSVVIPLAESARTFFKGQGENVYFVRCAKAESALIFSRRI